MTINNRDLSPVFSQLTINEDADCSLAVQLANQLSWLIASNQLKPGDRLPTIRGLAEVLGINLHTVRAAYLRLEEYRMIKTRRGTGSVVLGFDPSAVGGQSTAIRTHMVGLIVPDLSGPFYPMILKGVQWVAQHRHILVIACGTDEDPQAASDQLDMLIAQNVDGVIIASDYLPFEEGTPFFHLDPDDYPIPLVFIDRPEQEGYSVLFDAAEAGYKATTHLLGHGYTPVAFISPSRKFPTYQLCFDGYRDALNEYQQPLPAEQIIETAGFTFQDGYEAMQALLARETLPRAVFVAEDLLAVAGMKAIRDAGLRIPEDIAVIGLNDFEISHFSDPLLSTVNTSAEELGVVAMRLMLQLLEGVQVEHSVITLPTRLILRQSCGCRLEP
ncbi:MAG: substrate-binding domain-containing protein [Anaerolineales bacterium]|nr:substrate-binding domain-containing protein [Anaerolineales bacterium]